MLAILDCHTAAHGEKTLCYAYDAAFTMGHALMAVELAARILCRTQYNSIRDKLNADVSAVVNAALERGESVEALLCALDR
jgi:hypothetical protein